MVTNGVLKDVSSPKEMQYNSRAFEQFCRLQDFQWWVSKLPIPTQYDDEMFHVTAAKYFGKQPERSSWKLQSTKKSGPIDIRQ